MIRPKIWLSLRFSSRITSYNVCYTKLLRVDVLVRPDLAVDDNDITGEFRHPVRMFRVDPDVGEKELAVGIEHTVLDNQRGQESPAQTRGVQSGRQAQCGIDEQIGTGQSGKGGIQASAAEQMVMESYNFV